jgi:predicted transporter
MFFGIYLTVIALLGVALSPLANKIMMKVPTWVSDASTLIACVVALFLLVLGFVLSFRAVRWFWRLNYPKSTNERK